MFPTSPSGAPTDILHFSRNGSPISPIGIDAHLQLASDDRETRHFPAPRAGTHASDIDQDMDLYREVYGIVDSDSDDELPTLPRDIMPTPDGGWPEIHLRAPGALYHNHDTNQEIAWRSSPDPQVGIVLYGQDARNENGMATGTAEHLLNLAGFGGGQLLRRKLNTLLTSELCLKSLLLKQPLSFELLSLVQSHATVDQLSVCVVIVHICLWSQHGGDLSRLLTANEDFGWIWLIVLVDQFFPGLFSALACSLLTSNASPKILQLATNHCL